ncbi:MFS transporter [Gracilibacillus salinarum]|uniref:MFS transporter n=1 Tax=Gracilibacillus salinarum TaxID=2932255 RepID=A0ABY4GT55_9BACI|nr:MFS transporter [Gracilibacillus salinarum]UOQ86852.1 MFS transporter [Gracilibacillus salinarum]
MKFAKLVLPGASMIAVTYGFARFSYGLLLPDINQSLGMSELVSGLISSMFYLAYCFTIILSTVVTTKEGPRKMISLAGLSAFVGMLLIAISPNTWILALGVLFAGGSTGLASPPFGTAISLWIKDHQQGKANTWVNSGTSIGIVLSGIGAYFLSPHWRITYCFYAILALLIWGWNSRSIPKGLAKSTRPLKKGILSFRGADGVYALIAASVTLGFSTATYWTFSRSYIEVAGDFNEWLLAGFWVMIGLFGILGGFSGSLIEKIGLCFAYKVASLAIACSSIMLPFTTGNWLMSYVSAGLFGCAYIGLTGILLVWGIRVFVTNASLGIGMPFLLLSIGQVIGSSIAGVVIESWSYGVSFMLYGFVGLIAIFLGPKKNWYL